MSPHDTIDKVTAFKIHLKNIPEDSTIEELKAIFEEFGRVIEIQIAFRKTFAFIYMEDESCGRAAITMLNERMIRGNRILVEESRQTDQGPNVHTTRLKVRNIPSTLKATDLRSLFVKYGMVVAAEISNGEGTVSIEAIADIRTAMNEVNGFVYDGQALIVEPIINTTINYTPRMREPPSRPPRPLFPNLSYRPGHQRPLLNSPRQGNNSFRPPRFDSMRGSRAPPPHWQSAPQTSNPWETETEGKVLRDPYGPGLRPLMPPHHPGQGFQQPLLPPPMHYQRQTSPSSFRPRMHQQPPPMQRHPRSLLSFPRGPRPSSASTEIEPLFLRRHEILKPGFNSNSSGNGNTQFYEDDSFTPPPLLQAHTERIPIYRPNEGNGNAPTPPHPGLPRPPPLFRNGPPVKRRVPEAEPGQAFDVPAMIPPGEFQPPKKYFANKTRPPNHKKKRAEPRPELPLPPEQPQRYVPDFSSQNNQVPHGSVLRAFPPPPPLMDQDFSADSDLGSQQHFY